MSVAEPSEFTRMIERAGKHIKRYVDEITRLVESNIELGEFFREYLTNVNKLLAAAAGAVWLVNDGQPTLQFDLNLKEIGLESESAFATHQGVLRQAIGKCSLIVAQPRSGQLAGDAANITNPTEYINLIAPIVVDNDVAGLVDVWLDPRRAKALSGAAELLTGVAFLASSFLRNHRLRELGSRESHWRKVEIFQRTIHESLDPGEVAMLVANQGRALIECDRLSVAQRDGRRVVVLAVSGADVVEKRSRIIQLMCRLVETVLNWNEGTLVYKGVRDDSLPPPVVTALDDFLEESNCKLLAVVPVRDAREKDTSVPPRSALVMECHEPTLPAEQLAERAEVIGRQSAAALYNAFEYRRIPLRWFWSPLIKLQDGLGGKNQAIVASIVAGVLLFLLAMVLIPYPLKLDATGQLLPENRAWIFPPREGHVVRFDVEPGAFVHRDQNLVLMHDIDLELKLVQLNKEIDAAEKAVEAAQARLRAAGNNLTERLNIEIERQKQEAILRLKIQERDRLRQRANAEEEEPGNFWMRSPIAGTILNADFREKFKGKYVTPADPILRIGDTDGSWQVELKIPQKHVGQVLSAFKPDDPRQQLDVDLLLLSEPTRSYRGKLSRAELGREAVPDPDPEAGAEPVVIAFVRIEGDDIPTDLRVPRSKLVTGTEVHAKIRCGNHAMGYSLFYGLWEFIYEKIIYFF
ncbi:MAG: hemolysin D [Gemmatales bacterium]|nr:MAG: hemolysin D [Gemmatales bacterium]